MASTENPAHAPETAVARVSLFFRTYQAATVPLYGAMIADLCRSQHLPHELATVLEDIGQAFLGFSDRVNAELLRRGVLVEEAEPDQFVEARVERMLDRIRGAADGLAPEAREERRLLLDESVQQALRLALLMIHDLPAAPRTR